MKYLKKIDIFGVNYKQQITLDEKAQTSVLGGIVSLLIISVSIGYFIYVMNEWISSNILPTTSNQMKAENYSEILFKDENLFEFCYWRYADYQMDPFRIQKNIITPVGYFFYNGIPQQPFSLLEGVSQSTYNSNLITINNLGLVQNSAFDKSLNDTTELLIILTKCNESLLIDGQTCASEEEMNQFFSASVNYVSFWLNLKQFNSQSESFEVVQKQYYLTFDQKVAQQGQLILKQTKATIDTGVLFGKYQYKNYISDAQFLTSGTQTNFWGTLLVSEYYFSLFVRLDPISYEAQIVYPKLGEVLAQIGSIVSLLMMAQYIITMYNEYLLDKNFIDKILQFYFYDYQEIKQSNKKMDCKTCKELKKSARKKLVYTNIIYELSRIQLFLLHKFGRTQLEECHQYALQARDRKDEPDKFCQIYNDFISVKQLTQNNQQKNEEIQVSENRPFEFERKDFQILQMQTLRRAKTIIISSIANQNDENQIEQNKSPSIKSIQLS